METTLSSPVSIYGRDECHLVAVSAVAGALAQELNSTRWTENYSFENAVESFLEKHAFSLPETHSATSVTDELWMLISKDSCYDSELNQARRAAESMLSELFGREMSVRGWIPGSIVRVRGEEFQLTGESCERCGVNPEAHGVGGGVRCIDQGDCGWQFCY